MNEEAINYDDIAEAPVTVSDDEVKSIAELAERQIVIEDWIEAQQARLKEAAANLKKLSEEKLPEAMRQAGVKTFTLDNGCKVEVDEGVYGNITKANQPWCFGWLRENNNGDLIKNEFKFSFGKGDDEQAKELANHADELGIEYNQKEFIHPQTLGAFIRTEVANPEVDHDEEWEKKFGVFRKRVTKIERPKT